MTSRPRAVVSPSSFLTFSKFGSPEDRWEEPLFATTIANFVPNIEFTKPRSKLSNATIAPVIRMIAPNIVMSSHDMWMVSFRSWIEICDNFESAIPDLNKQMKLCRSDNHGWNHADNYTFYLCRNNKSSKIMYGTFILSSDHRSSSVVRRPSQKRTKKVKNETAKH